MSNRRLAYYDVQPESSVRLFKSPLAGAGAYCVVSVPLQAVQLVTYYLLLDSCVKV